MSEPALHQEADRAAPHPWVWAVLYFPLGLAIGFPSVALGYLGAKSDLGVSVIAGIVGMTFLANGWKFLRAPVGDYTLTRKTWHLISVFLVGLGLIGDTAAAAKINLFFALNTLFRLGMLRAAGWAHDTRSTNGMLHTEALTGVAALALFALLARHVRGMEGVRT